MDFTIALQQFLDHSLYIRGLSQATINGYKRNITYFKNVEDIQSTEQITENKVRSFLLQGRVQKNWKSTTYIAYLKSIKVFVDWCHTMKFLEGDNFMDNIEKPKVPKSLPKGLSKDKAFRLLEIIQNMPYYREFLRFRNYAIFATFIYTGLRKSELINLKMVDIDIQNLTIFVRAGKGAKDRILPMNYKLANIYKIYLNERTRLNKTCPEFFTSYVIDKGFTRTGVQMAKRKIQATSGIKFTIHSLRHTFATLMLQGGCDIYSLSKMMGHSEISTTAIYLSTTAEHLRGEILKHPLSELS